MPPPSNGQRRPPHGSAADKAGPSTTDTDRVMVAEPADNLTQALAYAAAGWPVFPCGHGSKIPAIPSAHPEGDPARGVCTGECGRDGHGFHDATTDPDVLRAWWRKWPAANVAIATGAPGPDVLDVDVKPDGTGWPAFNRLKRAGYLTGACAIVRTPSSGVHIYFAGTSQPCGRLPRHHLDWKAAGGYVLAPPSRVDGKPYQMEDHRPGGGEFSWPAAVRLLDPPAPSAPRPAGSGNIVHLADWVAQQKEGNRNAGLYWAAKRAVEYGADPAELLPAAVAAGLSETEARATVASAARGSR